MALLDLQGMAPTNGGHGHTSTFSLTGCNGISGASVLVCV
jgi:hypothetical protein